MSTNGTSLFDFLPDYFQLDLDEPSRACVQAIDEVLQKFSIGECQEAASTSLLGTSKRRMLSDLQSSGFAASTLTAEELIKFSRDRHSILANADSLKGVGRLLDVYFPGASVQRGRPYPRTKLSTARGFRLSDRRDRRQVVSILLPAPAAPERLAEFLANCRGLLSFQISVEVRTADLDAAKKPAVWKLGQKTEGGRLGCRISPK